MRRILAALERVLDAISAALVAVCLAAVSIQVVMRYVFDNATTWSDTVASCALAWLTFLAATAAVRRNENLSVRFLWAMLDGVARKCVMTFCHVAALLFALVLGYSGLMLMQITRTTRVEGLVIDVSWAQFYSVSVVSGVLMVLFSLEHIAAVWLGEDRP
jgi:TRAP-type C4-dicarboxylate transport system permease small subunit